MRLFFVFAVSAAVVVSACSSGEPASPGGGSGEPPPAGTSPVAPVGAITFHKDVEPLLQKVCQDCHIAGGIAPFSLVTFADAKAVASSIVGQTAARTMPPWGAQDTAECKPPKAWKNDLRLSEAEIGILKAWHEGGDYEGDPKDAPPPRSAPLTTGLTGGTSLAPATPFTLAATSDTFRCFVLDPQLTSTKYLNGTNFVPTNKTIVHHALAFAIPPGTAVPANEYECFGGSNIPTASLVAAWAPGGVPNEYPADVGLALPAGTKFVMQIHYHPHANATKDPDATAFQFRVTDTPPTYQAVTRLIGNFKTAVGAGGIGLEPGADDPGGTPTFIIPADKPAHVETMKFQMPALGGGANATIWILGVGAHMHLAGHDEKITLTRDGQTSSCLMQEPAWDFNWQRGYQYDAPIESLPTIAKGDVLEIRCTYNNTMSNLSLANARREAGVTVSKDISMGESTTDEMCIGAFTFVYKAK
jgi:Copper type II ascorbate-dependent monooxygenase, N-terminal domain/Copper type II ascorbate-dependent monooxygenase, C-terminal domain